MKNSKTAIIDYGMGNLYSVRNSFGAVGVKADVVGSGGRLAAYDRLVLPGVGAFGDAMKELKGRGLIPAILDHVASGKPFLGICLGMQLLLDKSEESPAARGLGIVPGAVKRFSSRLKCPHMGWNKVEKRGQGRQAIFRGVRKDPYAYFCHSYYVQPRDRGAVAAETEYGVRFACVLRRGNVYGMQFHPEKSQEVGLMFLKNFILSC